MPPEAARDFLLGHLNIELAIVFGQVGSPFSDGAKLIIEHGRRYLIKPDWKRVFEPEEVGRPVAAQLRPIRRRAWVPPLILVPGLAAGNADPAGFSIHRSRRLRAGGPRSAAQRFGPRRSARQRVQFLRRVATPRPAPPARRTAPRPPPMSRPTTLKPM